MAGFTPSKKTAQDFNDGVEYVDGQGNETGDALQAETINNLVESALYTQDQADNAVNNASGAVDIANNALVVANGLDEQIKTANVTADIANSTSQEAKGIAEEAKEIAEDAQKGVGTKVTVGGKVVTTFDADTKVNKSGDIMAGTLRVNAPIIGYNYINNRSAPAFILDKAGSYASGIGASGEVDIIKFGAVKGFDEPVWQDDYKQKWSFNGEIIADSGQMTGELTIMDCDQSFNARGHYNSTPTIQYNNSFKSGFYNSSWEARDKCFVCGESNDKAVIQYSYSDGWHMRVGDNGNEVMNTRWLDNNGNLYNAGYKVFDGGLTDKYIRFANGVQICWGQTNGQQTAYFSAPFANTDYSIVSATDDAKRNAYGNINIESKTTTTCYIYHIDKILCSWMAIGKWR